MDHAIDAINIVYVGARVMDKSTTAAHMKRTRRTETEAQSSEIRSSASVNGRVFGDGRLASRSVLGHNRSLYMFFSRCPVPFIHSFPLIASALKTHPIAFIDCSHEKTNKLSSSVNCTAGHSRRLIRQTIPTKFNLIFDL